MLDFQQSLLLIDKPAGITSFDVIRCLRRYYRSTHGGAKAPKMGHAGTLDPLATGLMLIGVGAGTKQLTELTGLDKEYETVVRFGERRSTGDLAGEVLEDVDVAIAEDELAARITTALAGMVGVLTLPVSAYSAIKVDGVPMYKRAYQAERSGETVDAVPQKDMRVLEAELGEVTVDEGKAAAAIRFRVGSGTYIRSLAEELGRRIGCPATVQSLRRTKVGEYTVAEAEPLPDTQ